MMSASAPAPATVVRHIADGSSPALLQLSHRSAEGESGPAKKQYHGAFNITPAS
jgi:hypothetical protein